MTDDADAHAVGRPAQAKDVPAVAACLASAFHEDPLWGHWTFPAEGRRARDLLSFMTVMARLGPDAEWVELTPRGEAVTVWTPPGAIYGTPEQQPLIDELFERLFGPRSQALHDLFEQFDENLPPGRYYHLEWWATHRDHAGRGIGTALLRENLAHVDAQQLPCYLESTNPANLSRYEALGFRVLGSFAPPGGPTITTMWRDPR